MVFRFSQEIVGTTGGDSYSPTWAATSEIYFGRNGNDSFTPPFIPDTATDDMQIFVGGTGNDTYTINTQNALLFSQDGGGDAGDTLTASSLPLFGLDTAAFTDPPPLKWSTQMYVNEHRGGP
jgi:hypothetical protein